MYMRIVGMMKSVPINMNSWLSGGADAAQMVTERGTTYG
ncbi:hypothetical protein OHAE_5290 [Ochrobactrum soli]|uniref:Uncharacterized protein n=1 Tax=Ochrobactrum soli TaxID=2448455 RepID=A0A2P9HF07_9HYPH|nr:hypothetical protein OHAE_5290 [[Ochrobactrum] soli]